MRDSKDGTAESGSGKSAGPSPMMREFYKQMAQDMVDHAKSLDESNQAFSRLSTDEMNRILSRLLSRR